MDHNEDVLRASSWQKRIGRRIYRARPQHDRTPYARRGSGGDGRAKYGGPAGIFERHAGGRSGAGTCDACTDCGQYMEE